MESSNPVFNRSEGFKPGRGTNKNAGYAGYGSPSGWSTGASGGTSTADPYSGGTDYSKPPTHTGGGDLGRMTIDSTVQKTGITLAALVVAAALTWIVTPPLDIYGQAATGLYAVTIGAALIGFALAMVNSFKKVISPTLVLAYAVVEGVFIGAISKTYSAAFGDGVVTGAVLGTIAAFAGTLAAYKFLDIQVTAKFRRYVVAAGFGFVGVMLLDFVLSFFNAQLGFNGFGFLGLLFSIGGLVLGVFFLMLDFDMVERGVAAGLPERESWRAAFGLTVTLVWIYVNLLRLLAILRGN